MSDVTFDAEQAEAVEIEPVVRQIVIAGPGAGKTEVVAGLLQHLVDEEDVEPTDELLVISFSRAAVNAVRQRTRRDGSRARLTTVRTLDSLASAILTAGDSGDLRRASFDERVRQATGALVHGDWEGLEGLRHVVVDEVQDVVGVRADFLTELLRGLPEGCGFTLLGDPQQAIYDFQLRDLVDGTTSEEFVRRAEGLGARRVELRGQYRARTSETLEATGLGHRMRAAEDAERSLIVNDFVDRLPGIDSPEELALLLPRWEGRTVVLCATNGEALMVSRALRAEGVAVVQQRSAQEQSVDRWVADALGRRPLPSIAKSDLVEALEGGTVYPDSAWRALRAAVGGRGREVDVMAVARRLAMGVAPIDLQATSTARVVVSTVHRAKGLEFENAVLVNPQSWSAEEGVGTGEAARTAFVAVSRGRERLALLTMPREWGLKLDKRYGVRRWYLGHGGRRRGFEVVPSDIASAVPGGRDTGAVHELLSKGLAPGSRLSMRLDRRVSTLEWPVFEILHGDLVVGTTNDAFAEAFSRCVGKAATRDWPELGEITVENVVTIAGDPYTGGNGSVGRWGLWLGLQAGGLVDLSWT
ncbi:AAA family ATPase [Kineococcus sp. T13]|uniref:UvrD-helicase domain-containing protein n=1 Tax=Kineococcus vitellinus TaxID=2696565 RepID=UPI001411EA2F|nr:AAA family ATPase [Kineococcus vitellinus]